MTKIIESDDCGNSPKNQLLQRLTIAIATGATRAALDSVTDDIHWTMAGQPPIDGKAAFADALTQTIKRSVRELTIAHVVNHGKAGAVNGTSNLTNGQTRAFCNMFAFSTTKGTAVKAITSYVVEMPKHD